MTESLSKMAVPVNIVHWLQHNYTEEHGRPSLRPSLLGKDVYDNYVQCLADYSSDHRPVSKISFSKIMQRVFKTLQLSQTHGIRMYRGIKINIPDNRNCETDDLKALADVYGFFDMKANDKLKFGIGSGYCVNKNEVLKIIEIDGDKKWKFIVAGHEVEPGIIGMPPSMTCEMYLNAKIIFNTVKQAKICIGREEEKDKRSSRFRIVQEWNVCDENIIKVRSTSRKCQRVLLFSAMSEACPNCYNTKDYVPSIQKDTTCMSDDEMFNKLFPGACDTMRKHLQEQSKCCRNNKDPCCHSRDKETIRNAMPLWNRSTQQEMASDTDIEGIIVALKHLTETIEDLLKYGREAVQVSIDGFVDEKIGKLFGFATAYQKCLARLEVKTKHDLEKILHKHARNAELRELSMELLDLEQEWDVFLGDIDRSLDDDSSEVVQLGQTGPIHDSLIDSEISAANGKVIVITFGLREGALRWLEETKSPYTLLMDHHRKTYHAFGLKRSVLKVWGVNSLVYYAEEMAAGRPLPKPYENVHDDPQQMGGNFIIDKHGIARFLYPSQTSMDRPAIDLLIQELQKIEK